MIEHPWHSLAPDDPLAVELDGFSNANRYPVQRIARSVCDCGNNTFNLYIDDEECAAVRACAVCEDEYFLLDSRQHVHEAGFYQCECPCGGDTFEVAVGFALFQGSTDVRWIYIGGKCRSCGKAGTYVDWKCDGGDVDEYLAQV